MSAFGDGILAGLAIAVPVGAIAVLILELAMRRGFPAGWAAGAGAASVDVLYATLAGLAGQALAPSLAPAADALRVASGLALIGLGVWGLFGAWRYRAAAGRPPALTAAPGLVRLYFQFVGLTLLNPMTVVYFTALMVGQNARTPWAGLDRLAFVAGVALASFGWQSLLAALGAWARRRLPARAQVWTSLLGNLVVLGLGLRLIWPG